MRKTVFVAGCTVQGVDHIYIPGYYHGDPCWKQLCNSAFFCWSTRGKKNLVGRPCPVCKALAANIGKAFDAKGSE